MKALKSLLTILASLIAMNAFGGSGIVTAHLDLGRTDGTPTNLMFTCNVTLDNRTGATLTARNLFSISPGLALTATDLEGHELAKMYAWPWHKSEFHIPPGTHTFTRLLYGVKPMSAIGASLPPDTKKLKLQIVGFLPGSSYTNRLTSNVVEATVP